MTTDEQYPCGVHHDKRGPMSRLSELHFNRNAYNLARQAIWRKKYPEAAMHARRALLLDPEDLRAEGVLGECHLIKGEFAEAILSLIDVAERDPVAAVHLALARIASRGGGEFRVAIHDLKMALKQWAFQATEMPLGRGEADWRRWLEFLSQYNQAYAEEVSEFASHFVPAWAQAHVS